MQKFKDRWEIKNNWQLIFPFLGILGLVFSSLLISRKIIEKILQLDPSHSFYILIVSIFTFVVSILLLLVTLRIFGRLEKKWAVTYRWELIAIFIAFAVTGSTAARVSAPLLHFFGLQGDTINGWIYWPLRILLIFPVYQVLLLIFGWLFGQFTFFWNFEKKMLRRMGFARFLKD